MAPTATPSCHHHLFPPPSLPLSPSMIQCNLGKIWKSHPPRQSFFTLSFLHLIWHRFWLFSKFCIAHLVKAHLISSNATYFKNYPIKSKILVKVMEVWSCFSNFPEQDFFKLVCSVVKNMERLNTGKRNTINIVFKALR